MASMQRRAVDDAFGVFTMRLGVAKIGALLLFAVGLVVPGGCATNTTSRIVAFTPQNREAQAIGPLTGYLNGHGGDGDIWLKLRNGEEVRGRFKVKAGGSFGAYGKAHGLDRPGGAYSIAGGNRIVGGDPAFIDMKGPSGVTVHCEVLNDRGNAHGSGDCLFSNGAEYQVVY